MIYSKYNKCPKYNPIFFAYLTFACDDCPIDELSRVTKVLNNMTGVNKLHRLITKTSTCK